MSNKIVIDINSKGVKTARRDVEQFQSSAVVGVGAYDLGKTLLQIGNAGGKAENCHHLAGNGDIKAVLAGGAVYLAAQTVHDEPQLAVVHVHAALPCDAAGVDVQRVALLDAVIDHGSQQVVVAVPMACRSPVKCRLISSMGTTCA